jgi:hypothetical protein
MQYSIDTGKYKTKQKILVDGKSWTLIGVGAGTELALNQSQRRAKIIEKKVESGEATEDDLDRLDQLENKMFQMFRGVFKDNTEDNSEVEAWLQQTPMPVIYAILEDIKNQVEAGEAKKEVKDGADTAATEPTVS